jgi:hypothetical protein
MQHQDNATHAPPSTSSVATELDRLRRARPHLENRIDRAERIVVAQLSLANGHRPIKVRIRQDGSHVFRVRSGSKMKVAYNVDPGEDFRCTCPWAESGGSGCSHSISCWILVRARYRRPAKTFRCQGCGERFPNRELFEAPDDHLTFFEGDALCLECAGNHGVL